MVIDWKVVYIQVKVFFEQLDDELNKVNQFYGTREREFLERGEILNKQLQILLDLKQFLKDRRRKNSSSKLNSTASVPSSLASSPRSSDYTGEFSLTFYFSFIFLLRYNIDICLYQLGLKSKIISIFGQGIKIEWSEKVK